MESDSGIHGEVADGAEVGVSPENQPVDAIGDLPEDNVTSQDEAIEPEESGTF